MKKIFSSFLVLLMLGSFGLVACDGGPAAVVEEGPEDQGDPPPPPVDQRQLNIDKLVNATGATAEDVVAKAETYEVDLANLELGPKIVKLIADLDADIKANITTAKAARVADFDILTSSLRAVNAIPGQPNNPEVTNAIRAAARATIISEWQNNLKALNAGKYELATILQFLFEAYTIDGGDAELPKFGFATEEGNEDVHPIALGIINLLFGVPGKISLASIIHVDGTCKRIFNPTACGAHSLNQALEYTDCNVEPTSIVPDCESLADLGDLPEGTLPIPHVPIGE